MLLHLITNNLFYLTHKSSLFSPSFHHPVAVRHLPDVRGQCGSAGVPRPVELHPPEWAPPTRHLQQRLGSLLAVLHLARSRHHELLDRRRGQRSQPA